MADQQKQKTYIYCDDRLQALQEINDLNSKIKNGDNPIIDVIANTYTVSKECYIVGVGKIQYNHFGYKTEQMCGYRCKWRVEVFIQ